MLKGICKAFIQNLCFVPAIKVLFFSVKGEFFSDSMPSMGQALMY